MKILCVSGYYKPAHVYGGPTYSVPSLLEGMSALGADVSVFTTNANGLNKTLDIPLGEDINVEGVNVKYFPISRPISKIFPFYSVGLREACSKYITDFDVAYLQGVWPYTTYVAAKMAIHHEVPYIITPRGEFMEWSIKQSYVKKRIYLALSARSIMNNATAIHTTCKMETNQTKVWDFNAPLVEIPNPINLSLFGNLPALGNFRQKINIPHDSVLSIFVGRLHKMKRLDLTIRAFSEVRKEEKEIHLAVIGPDEDGSLNEAIEIVKERNLEQYVHFTGLLPWDQLVEAYVDADILVLLSHRENFGMVVGEAMARGIPVLITEQVGLSPEIKKYQTGYSTADDIEVIVDRWIKLIQNPDIRKSMGERGKKLIQDKYSSEAVSSKMYNYMAALCEDI